MTLTTQPRRHFHLFAFHRHADWHGHCELRGYFGEPVRCKHRCRHNVKCARPRFHWGRHAVRVEVHLCTYFTDAHNCRRWHFHGPFRHRHTPDGH